MKIVVKRNKMPRGFTLIELIIVIAILTFCLCGILATYINMFFLSALLADFTLATNAIQAKMEEIKKMNFDVLLSLNATTFNIRGFNSSDAKGRIEVCDNATCPTLVSYTDLKRLRLIVCFKSRGRIIGEDKNLNGNLDTGEDTLLVNNRLDSPVELITLIAR